MAVSAFPFFYFGGRFWCPGKFLDTRDRPGRRESKKVKEEIRESSSSDIIFTVWWVSKCSHQPKKKLEKQCLSFFGYFNFRPCHKVYNDDEEEEEYQLTCVVNPLAFTVHPLETTSKTNYRPTDRPGVSVTDAKGWRRTAFGLQTRRQGQQGQTFSWWEISVATGSNDVSSSLSLSLALSRGLHI